MDSAVCLWCRVRSLTAGGQCCQQTQASPHPVQPWMDADTARTHTCHVCVSPARMHVGGFDGRGGWVQSKLLVKPTASMYGSSSPLPGITRTVSTRTESTRGRKALPAPSK